MSQHNPPEELGPTERFSSRAEGYARYRPGYPADLPALLAHQVSMTQASVIADVGAGTGILSELLLRHGNPVIAIEPNDAMRLIAERLLASYPRFRSLNSTAEQIDLPDASVDGITVAQAFHWFDGPKAAAEFRRILKPGGFMALIWNVRDTAASVFMAEYERIVHTYGTEFARSNKETVSAERLRELFGPELKEHTLPNFQDLDWPGLRGRLLSASYMPLAGQSGFEPMLDELQRAFDTFQSQGHVRLEYITRVYLVRPQ